MHLLPISAAILFPILAYGINTIVQVGQSGLQFSPQTVKAAAGDTVEFHFYPNNHSVVQSSFEEPCKPIVGGFNSGFVPIAEGASVSSISNLGLGNASANIEKNKSFTITVKDANPIWVYCSQNKGSHCQIGMAMVINEPSAPKTLETYKSMASNTTVSEPPNVVEGGVFGFINVPATATTTSGSLYASVTSLIASAASNAPISTPMSLANGASSVMTTAGSLGALIIAGAADLIMFYN